MSIGVSEASLSDIAAVTNNRNNDGMFGNDWAWIVILLLFGWGRNGFGFGGGYGNGCSAPCATQADVRAAVDQQTLISKIDQLEDMMEEAEKPTEKEALRRCMDALKRA